MSDELGLTARDLFRKGDRVQLTTAGRERFPRSPPMGVVIGFSYDSPFGLRVLPDGRKTAVTFHCADWMRTDTA